MPVRAKGDSGVDLRRFIAMARVWGPLMVLVAVMGGLAAYAVSSAQQKVYESRATLIVGQSLSTANPDYSQLLVAQSLAATYATIAETRPILERTIEALGLDLSPDALAGQVLVEARPDTALLTVTASDGDPAQAAAIANALASQLIEASPTIQGREADFQRSIDADLAATQTLIESTQATVDQLIAIEERTPEQEAQLLALEGRLATLRQTFATLLSFASGNATNLLAIVDPAVPVASPVSPRPLVNALLAAVVAILVVAGIAFLTEQLDESMKDPDAVQQAAGLTTLGTVGRMPVGNRSEEFYRLAGLLHPHSSYAESYRKLRTNIDFSSVDKPLQAILVTSAAPGEGKTVTAANLAVIFAQAGRSVLLVDADLRRPGIERIFNLPNTTGLTTLLRGDPVPPERVIQATEEPNLSILTTGPLPPNPAELLASQRMRRTVDILRKKNNLVIFDSPPVDVVTDAAVLSSLVDGTLLVVDATRSRRRVVRRATEALARAGANTIGAVLNRTRTTAPSFYGEYHAAAPTSQPPPATSSQTLVEEPPAR